MKRKVQIAKAAYSTRKGEHVGLFLRRIRDALQERFSKMSTRENDYRDGVQVWPEAVLPNRIIFERCLWEGGVRKARTMASNYTRDEKTSKFTFDEPVEVIKETEFVPIQKRDDMQIHWLGGFWDEAVPTPL